MLGLPVEQLATPCLIVHLAALERNLSTMARTTSTAGVRLRPHFKVHRSLDIARRQIELGAVGICTGSVAQAELLAAQGIRGTLFSPGCAVKGRPDVTVDEQGAEHGRLCFVERGFAPGDLVKIVPASLDLSTNAFDRYFVVDGGMVVAVWPIAGRHSSHAS